MVTSQQPTVVTEEPGRRERAPGRLRLVQDFVNTWDIETGADEIAHPEGLRDWLRIRGLLPRWVAVTDTDLSRATTLREALRALLLAHHGEPPDGAALRAVNAAAATAHLTLRFDRTGGYRLQPVAEGVNGALGEIVAAVSEAIDAGTWSRLKACRNDACQWAFYDSSRNRSGSWCTMAVCGNRMKSRAYRARRRGPKATAH